MTNKKAANGSLALLCYRLCVSVPMYVSVPIMDNGAAVPREGTTMAQRDNKKRLGKKHRQASTRPKKGRAPKSTPTRMARAISVGADVELEWVKVGAASDPQASRTPPGQL